MSIQYLRIKGGTPLQGEISVSGSKNAALPLICATLLTDQECILKNVPDIADIQTLLKIVKFLGSEFTFENNTLTIRTEKILKKPIPHEYVKGLRASILLLAPILVRNGRVQLSYPGGCPIGKRPIESHLHGFKKLGAHISQKNDLITLTSDPSLIGAEIVFPEASVTATENILIASCTAKGNSNLKIASFEPHVQDLCKMLNKMGAKIRGFQSPFIHVQSVKKLHGVTHSVTSDYLEVGTLAAAAAVTRGEVRIKKTPVDQLDILWQKFEEAGVPFKLDGNSVTILPYRHKLKPITKLKTGVFPAFPTDLQAPFTVLLTQAKGVSKVFETMFEGRLGYLFELEKMGAKIEILNANQALIIGPTKLRGLPIASCDLRAGAAMVVAALCAKGVTEISNINYIDRGYENLDVKLKKLGADIERFQV